ncbi:hypothetical protein [Thalassolituus sp.]|uniref:hypothetical protein n=1 Tax=Thalassolituus sp. TaxID=2030822 RepID=UPI0035185E56
MTGWLMVVIAVTAVVLVGLSFKSYPLINGYRLQGPSFTQGWIFNGWWKPSCLPEIMGVQGCKDWLIGNVKGHSENSYFILNTSTEELTRYSSNEWYAELRKAGCRTHMNDDTNLKGLQLGETFHPGF